MITSEFLSFSSLHPIISIDDLCFIDAIETEKQSANIAHPLLISHESDTMNDFTFFHFFIINELSFLFKSHSSEAGISYCPTLSEIRTINLPFSSLCLYRHLADEPCLPLCVALCLVTQSCLTLCNPMNCSLPGFYCPWGFFRQEYWSGLPCPLPGDLPNPGIEPRSPALQADSLPS